MHQCDNYFIPKWNHRGQKSSWLYEILQNAPLPHFQRHFCSTCKILLNTFIKSLMSLSRKTKLQTKSLIAASEKSLNLQCRQVAPVQVCDNKWKIIQSLFRAGTYLPMNLPKTIVHFIYVLCFSFNQAQFCEVYISFEDISFSTRIWVLEKL